MQLIFEDPAFKNQRTKKPSQYWIPLLGLFTGARQAELCQLEVRDITQDGDTAVWIIDINDDGPDKRLKTNSSRRKVPVHPKLQELGFLGFVKEAQANEQKRLFPEEMRNSRGEFDAFSKRFNRYLVSVGVSKGEGLLLNFHSFRHTLQTYLLDRGHEEFVVNGIVGHTPARRSMSVRTYSHGAGLPAKLETLEKFDPEIDFEDCDD